MLYGYGIIYYWLSLLHLVTERVLIIFIIGK
jgi:hypothetical protein